ncbi:MAG: signal peptidase I [Brevundimonas sp.]
MSDDPKANGGAGNPAIDPTEQRPIWSDDGDAPFDMGDDPEALDSDKPIYATPRPKKAKRVKKEKSASNETVEIIKTVVFALLIAFVLRVLLFQPFTIPSASMEPNLYEGDYIVVSKWSYGYSKHSIPWSPPLFDGRIMGKDPTRGDIVVFKLPRDNKTDYIKRVIGLPGDKVQMIANKLYINGAPVKDVVVSRAEMADMFGPRPVTQVRETLPNGKVFMTQDFGPGGDLDDTPVYEVPAGHFFMMASNPVTRYSTRDYMRQGVGMVPAENLVGKAEIIMFSWSPGASLFNPVSWFANLRPSRFFKILD